MGVNGTYGLQSLPPSVMAGLTVAGQNGGAPGLQQMLQMMRGASPDAMARLRRLLPGQQQPSQQQGAPQVPPLPGGRPMVPVGGYGGGANQGGNAQGQGLLRPFLPQMLPGMPTPWWQRQQQDQQGGQPSPYASGILGETDNGQQ